MNRRNETEAGDGERLERRAKQLFDESVESLDARTLSRLNQSRQAALAAARSGSGFRTLSPWVPAAGFAAAAVFAVVLWTSQPPSVDVAPASAASDFEMLLDDDSIEMFSELEFYSWIELDGETETEESQESHVG